MSSRINTVASALRLHLGWYLVTCTAHTIVVPGMVISERNGLLTAQITGQRDAFPMPPISEIVARAHAV